METRKHEFTASLDTQRWIELEKLRLIIANMPVALALSFAAACFFAFVLRGANSTVSLLLWLVISAGIAATRYWHSYQFRRLKDSDTHVRHWRTRIDVGTAISGCWWGCGIVMLFPPDMPHQAYVAFVMAGISAGAMTSYAALQRTAFLFLFPSTIPELVMFLLQGNEDHLAMGIMVGMFLLVVSKSAANTSKVIDTVLKLRAENIELTRALHHEATHDPLVDVINYREFNARLKQLAATSAKEHRPYALVFIDLDHFKQVNDSAGHAAGDAVLRHIGTLLKTTLRSTDTAARMGGDEFAVLLPNCPRLRAEQIGTLMLDAIRDFELEWDGKRYCIGASIGIAYADAGEYDAEIMLRAADAACYEAKRAGRNQIRIHQADPAYAASGRFDLNSLYTLDGNTSPGSNPTG